MPVFENTDPGARSMKGLHVYHYFLSSCARRVTLAREEKGQDRAPHAINLFTQENTTDEYFRINPKGLVPALVHDGVVVTCYMNRRGSAVDFRRYPNICNRGERVIQRPSFKGGVARLQPWYAPLVCLLLRTRSRIRRGGSAPTRPRLAEHNPS